MCQKGSKSCLSSQSAPAAHVGQRDLGVPSQHLLLCVPRTKVPFIQSLFSSTCLSLTQTPCRYPGALFALMSKPGRTFILAATPKNFLSYPFTLLSKSAAEPQSGGEARKGKNTQTTEKRRNQMENQPNRKKPTQKTVD